MFLAWFQRRSKQPRHSSRTVFLLEAMLSLELGRVTLRLKGSVYFPGINYTGGEHGGE